MKRKLFLFSVLFTILFGAQVNASINPYMGNLKAESMETEATSLVAQKWTEETDLPGLGLKTLYQYGIGSSYTVLLEDGVTTLGLLKNGDYLYVTGINTTAKEVAIPENVTINGIVVAIVHLGYNSLDFSGATNLKSVTVPVTCIYVNIAWRSKIPILNLYMKGDAPDTGHNIPSNIDLNVYTTKEYYWRYMDHYLWRNANILQDGWDFEWMTVNVGRKGEFAQTYIEMTDADWSLGVYVKVTGTLNEADLNNIKNLTRLMKLDLSEAEFSSLPSSFLSGKEYLIEVILPDSLTTISSSAFYNCSRLQKVTAPGVKSISSSAFYNCYKLTNLDLSNVTTINSSAFYYCSSFNPTTLSPDLKYIGDHAFYNTAITEVTIPEGVTIINSSVFSECTQLQKVTLPNTITTINDFAFYNCSNLVEINIPEGVTVIDSYAFGGCSKITEITLPSTLQSIASGVFSDCKSLTTVKCKAIVPPVTNGGFTYNVDLNHCTLYIAPFTIDAYRAASNWNKFYIMKPLNEPVKNIYVKRPMTFDLLSEDNAVLQENPNMTLDWSSSSYVGQLSASGDGTLSAGVFSIYHRFYRRTNSSNDVRTTLVNNAENMRADSVTCSINFEKNYWHFISFQYDVKMEDIFGLNNTDFVIRRYNGANRASGDGSTSNWEQLSAGDVLEAGKGYIIQAANNSYDENGSTNAAVVRFPSRNTVTKNRLFTSNNVIVPLEEYPAEFAHNRSWNLVGNPYPCYYDMHYLQDDFTTPIILWRGTSYQAYSPVDDDIILRPNEAFFVQRPIDTKEMVFGADGRMHYDEAYNKSVTPGIKIAPMRTEGATLSRSVFNFNIEGCGSDDRTRIVMNEDASMEYEISCDASKFFAETSAGSEIYVDGAVKYDICERPLADGTAALGVRIAKDGDYTISLTGRSIDGWTVILKDTEAATIVDLTEEAYTFKADAGTYQNRFELTFKPFGTTSIDENISSVDNTNVRIINALGVTVFEGKIDEFKADAPAGVYVVVDSEKNYKIVIK